MEINEKLVKYNFSSRKGTSIKYIVIHDTGNTSKGADANAHFSFFNSADRQSSAHYFVDDTQVLRIIKDSDKAWHCGDGNGKYGITNENSLGIEICINMNGNFNIAFDKTAELTSFLMKKYNITLENVVRHYDASRKICPNSMSKNNWMLWDDFLTKVNRYYINESDQSTNNNEIIIYDKISNFIDNVYIAFFNRTPDYEGKSFWYNKIKSKQASLEDFVNSVMNSSEFIELKNSYI